MKDHYIFDIPIYVCEKIEYYADLDKDRENHFRNLYAQRDLADLSSEMSRTDMVEEEQFIRSEFGGPWNFNSVVGWIRLYATSSYIGGNLWRVEGKRLRRKMKSKIFWEVGEVISYQRISRQMWNQNKSILKHSRQSKTFQRIIIFCRNDLSIWKTFVILVHS